MRELIERLEEGRKFVDGEIITEGQMRWKVFNVTDKAITKKRLFKYLTDREPKGAEYSGLNEKTLEIDPPEKLDMFMSGGYYGYHCIFRCWGEVFQAGTSSDPEKYKAWGYVFSGIRSTSKGIEVASWVYVNI